MRTTSLRETGAFLGHRPRHRAAVALVALAALTLTACGGESAAPTTPTTPTAPTAPTTPTTPTTPSTPSTPEPEPGNAEESQFYVENRGTIEMILGSSPGGGTDVGGRFIAPYFSHYIVGNPPIQGVNVPGGGGILGANTFWRAPSDGFTFIYGAGATSSNYIFQHPSIEYDYEDMVPIMGMPSGRTALGGARMVDTSPRDWVNFDPPLIVGGTSHFGLDGVDAIALKLLGIPHRIIWGYDGSGPQTIAMEQGEIDLYTLSTGAYNTTAVPLIEAGTATPLFVHCQVDSDGLCERDPSVPDLPTVAELYEEIHGAAPSGLEWEAYMSWAAVATSVQKVIWLKADNPPEAIQAWLEAADKVAADPDIRARATDIVGDYDFLVRDSLHAAIDYITGMSDEARDWIINTMVEDHGGIDPRLG